MTLSPVGDGKQLLTPGDVDASGVDGRDLDVVAGSAETSTPEALTRFGPGCVQRSSELEPWLSRLRFRRAGGSDLFGL